MIDDHTSSLHHGVAHDRSHKLESAHLESLAHGLTLVVARALLVAGSIAVEIWPVVDKRPEKVVKDVFLAGIGFGSHLQNTLGIVNDRLDLCLVAHDVVSRRI